MVGKQGVAAPVSNRYWDVSVTNMSAIALYQPMPPCINTVSMFQHSTAHDSILYTFGAFC